MGSVEVVEKPIFIKKSHELNDLLKMVKRGSSDAVQLLIDTMNAKEEDGVPLKTKLECANSLIDLEVSITKHICNETLNRQIAEVKMKGLKSRGSDGSDGDKPKPPMMDFSTIQAV